MTSEPVLVYRNYGIILAYPSYKASGTKLIRNHIGTVICRQVKQPEQSLSDRKNKDQQISIQAVFSKIVSPV